MKTIKLLFVSLCMCCGTGLFFAQRGKCSPDGDFKRVTFAPAAASNVPIEITVDYSREKGEFSKYLFTCYDSPYVSEEGLQLAKEANFKNIATMHFIDDIARPDEKGRLLSRYALEGVIFYHQAKTYLPEDALKKNIDTLLEKINSLQKIYPHLEIKTFLFGNEPDLPGGRFWNGTTEQFFQNYATFATYLKSKNPNYIVGGPGFAVMLENQQLWIEGFIRYVSERNLPLDFVAFHSYSFEIKNLYVERMNYFKELLSKYPIRSSLFGSVKIADTEWDIRFPSSDNAGKYNLDMDTIWRAAHNVLALSAMIDNGLWMSCSRGGPFRNSNPEEEKNCDFIWVKYDGTKKPIYYAYKAFNALADTVQLSQEGSNYETFALLAGKRRKEDILIMVISSFDGNAYLNRKDNSDFLRFNAKTNFLAPGSVKTYKSYTITVTNLPWKHNEILILERYLVDDTHRFELVETTGIKGGSEITINRSIDLPQVQLIKIYKKQPYNRLNL